MRVNGVQKLMADVVEEGGLRPVQFGQGLSLLLLILICPGLRGTCCQLPGQQTNKLAILVVKLPSRGLIPATRKATGSSRLE